MPLKDFLAARLAIVFALMLAMVGTGFAHQFAHNDLDDDLTAYLAAGGSYADLCGDLESGHAGGATCDACRLVDSARVPAVSSVVLGCERATAVILTISPLFVGAPSVKNPAHPTRAPPVV